MGQDGATDFCEVRDSVLRLSKNFENSDETKSIKYCMRYFYALCLSTVNDLVDKILTQCLNSELQEDGRRVPENPEPWTWFWVNSVICSVSYMWVMIAVSNSWNCSATRSAVC